MNDNTAENMEGEFAQAKMMQDKNGQDKAAPDNVTPLHGGAEHGADNGAARVQELEAQLAAMKNEALRALADAENSRKRMQKEREDTAKFAVSKFAKDMLDVADNLQRALQAVKPEMLEGNAAIKNLFVGVEATERQLASIFERSGIQKIDPLGQPFDPNFHSVVVEMEATGQAPGTVVQVLQVGYRIHDRLLREAMVAVAKAGGITGQMMDQKA